MLGSACALLSCYQLQQSESGTPERLAVTEGQIASANRPGCRRGMPVERSELEEQVTYGTVDAVGSSHLVDQSP